MTDAVRMAIPARRGSHRHLRTASLLVGIIGAVAGCHDSPPPRASGAAADLPAVLATVGSERITAEEVRAKVAIELEQLELQHARDRSTLLVNALQHAIRDRLFHGEASRLNTDVDRLIAAEAGGRLEPTDAEIATWYEENSARVGHRTLQQMAPRIRELLREQRTESAILTLERRLAASRGVVVHMPPFQVPLNNDGAPSAGSAAAPVTIVEFSDFQCGYCARFAQTLERIRQEFGDDVRVVYRQFPLVGIHPDAFKAAEASLCAHEQGRFWEMHDAMFRQQQNLGVSALKRLAADLELHEQRFQRCLDTGRFTEQVQNDVREGRIVGVTGTPAVFVNGVPLKPGAQPFEVVAGAIREALSRGRH